MIGEISTYHLCQPLTLCRDRFVHPPPQVFFKGFQLRAHPIATALALKLEVAGTGAPADMFKAQKVERLRFPKPPSGTILSRKATEFDQTGLLRMQRQRKLLQPLAQFRQKTLGIVFVLKTGDNIVGVAHVGDVAASLAVSPPFGPQVKAVVQINV